MNSTSKKDSHPFSASPKAWSSFHKPPHHKAWPGFSLLLFQSEGNTKHSAILNTPAFSKSPSQRITLPIYYWNNILFLMFFRFENDPFLSNEIWTSYLLWRVDLHLGSHGGGLLPRRLLFDFGSFGVRRCCRWSCHWSSTCDQLFKFLILQPAATKKSENESV